MPTPELGRYQDFDENGRIAADATEVGPDDRPATGKSRRPGALRRRMRMHEDTAPHAARSQPVDDDPSVALNVPQLAESMLLPPPPPLPARRRLVSVRPLPPPAPAMQPGSQLESASPFPGDASRPFAATGAREEPVSARTAGAKGGNEVAWWAVAAARASTSPEGIPASVPGSPPGDGASDDAPVVWTAARLMRKARQLSDWSMAAEDRAGSNEQAARTRPRSADMKVVQLPPPAPRIPLLPKACCVLGVIH